MKVTVSLVLSIFIFISCSNSENPIENKTNNLNVSLRMETHVVDSLYRMYSIPLIKTYLYTYKLSANDQKTNEEYSDTTTCPNGWAVKELYCKMVKGDKIFLGATTKNPPDNFYQFDSVTYSDLIRFEDINDTIRFVKTFTIYE